MKAATLILVAVVFVGVSFLVLRQSRTHATPREFRSTDELVQYLAGEAVTDADRENHVRLDYSVGSIKDVERILGSLHDQYVKNSSSISVNGLAWSYGAYVGEVIRRSEPNARWEKSDIAGGEKSYPLIWSAGHSYPMAWCYHRIINGPEDDVWVKYSVLREKSTEKTRSPEDEAYRAKMSLVVQEAIRQAQDPSEKSAFQAGNIFVNINGLDLQVVGVSIPLNTTGKKAAVSFAADHFKQTGVATLAKEALKDFQNAKLAIEN